MPCARGMNSCRPDCLHRRKVLDYRTARHAAELAREQATGGVPGQQEAEGEGGGDHASFLASGFSFAQRMNIASTTGR